MIPLKDDLPHRRFPLGTVGLIGVNLLTFLWEIGSGDPRRFEFVLNAYGAIPWRMTHLLLTARSGVFPPLASVFSSMFLHGSVAHLAGNILFLWVFGRSIEDAMGTPRFLGFYFLSGISAAATQVAMMPSSHLPMVGASGAIAGVLGAYFMFFPRQRVLTLIPIFVFIRLVYVPAAIFLGLWFLMQLFAIPQALGGGAGVAFLAHVGGFVSGLVLARVFSRGLPPPVPSGRQQQRLSFPAAY